MLSQGRKLGAYDANLITINDRTNDELTTTQVIPCYKPILKRARHKGINYHKHANEPASLYAIFQYPSCPSLTLFLDTCGA